jgi:hypothetical protein
LIKTMLIKSIFKSRLIKSIFKSRTSSRRHYRKPCRCREPFAVSLKTGSRQTQNTRCKPYLPCRTPQLTSQRKHMMSSRCCRELVGQDHGKEADTRWRALSVTVVSNRFGSCHTRFSEENQVLNYMYARIKFHTYSDIIVSNINNIT